MANNNQSSPQEYISLAECAKKWKMPVAKIEQLCAEDKLEGAAKLGRTWIIPVDTEKPIVESRLSRTVIPENAIQEAALRHVEDGVPFTVRKQRIGNTTYIVSSVFQRQGPTIEEKMISLMAMSLEKETGIRIPMKELEKMRCEARKNSGAAKETFDDYIYTNRENLKSYGFSDEDIEVLLEKIAEDYEPFEL